MVLSILLSASILSSMQLDESRTLLTDEDVRPKSSSISRDGRILAIAGGSSKGGDWKVFSLESGKCLVDGTLGNSRSWGAWAACLSNKGEYLAVGGNYNNLYVVRATNGELVWNMSKEGHVGVIHDLYFTPDDTFLISNAGDMMMRVWNIKEKRTETVIRFTSTNPRLNQWQSPGFVERALRKYEIKGSYLNIYHGGLLPGANVMAIAGDTDAKVPFLDFLTGDVRKELKIKQATAVSLEITPDGKWLVVGGCNKKGEVEIWDIEKNEFLTSFGRHEGAITHIAMSPDKSTVISGGPMDGFRVWDVKTGKQKFSYFTKEDKRLPRESKPHPDGSRLVQRYVRSAGVGFLPDGKTFFYVPSGWVRTEVYFHDTATGEPVDFRERVKALPGKEKSPKQ